MTAGNGTNRRGISSPVLTGAFTRGRNGTLAAVACLSENRCPGATSPDQSICFNPIICKSHGAVLDSALSDVNVIHIMTPQTCAKFSRKKP